MCAVTSCVLFLLYLMWVVFFDKMPKILSARTRKKSVSAINLYYVRDTGILQYFTSWIEIFIEILTVHINSSNTPQPWTTFYLFLWIVVFFCNCGKLDCCSNAMYVICNKWWCIRSVSYILSSSFVVHCRIFFI